MDFLNFVFINMKIENVALLIPIHPPHYQFVYDLLNKLKANDIHIDIHLVFSKQADCDKFAMKNEIHPIICTPFYTFSVVTHKKFFGLKHLCNSKYDYIICCDSEIDIICDNFTNENIHSKIHQIFDNKKIYCGEIGTKIMEKSAELFPEKYEYLKNITQNFTLYSWWSDLPVYRRADIKPFLDMIKCDNMVWEHFDHIIYQYYLILYHNFEIVNTTPITNLQWSLEKLSTNDSNVLNGLQNINYGFSWSNKKFYDLNTTFVESQKGFLIYNLDRK